MITFELGVRLYERNRELTIYRNLLEECLSVIRFYIIYKRPLISGWQLFSVPSGVLFPKNLSPRVSYFSNFSDLREISPKNLLEIGRGDTDRLMKVFY